MRPSSDVASLATESGSPVVISRDRTATFDRFVDQHLDAAYRLARAILRDPTDAQDATHDAFVQAWDKWSTLRDPNRFDQWFDRILVNTCRNRIKRSSRWQARDISSQLDMASADQFGPAEDRKQIGDAIASLSPDHQVVVALSYFLDLSLEQIALRLGVPVGTVQSRLHYALQHLHATLGKADQPGVTP